MVPSQSLQAPGRVAPPTLTALLTCAGYHQDDLGKVYLLGIFAGFVARSFPVKTPAITVYLALTDGRGAPPITLRLVPADFHAAPLFDFTTPPARFPDPLYVKEIVIPVPPVTLPAPGVYLWQVAVGAEVVGERRFVVAGSP